MNKQFCATLSALILSLGLTACGKSPEPTEIPTSVPQQTQATQPTQPIQTESAFQEIKLVDNEHCTFTVRGAEEDGLFGYGLNVFLENKTDKELMFSLDGVSVNGYMCDPFWAVTVAAGKKANEQITFLESDLEANGIEAVSDITFTLSVYDNNDWLAEHLVEETFTVNP